MAVPAAAKKVGLAEARHTAEDLPDLTAAAGRAAGVDTPAAALPAVRRRAVAAACRPRPRTICRSNEAVNGKQGTPAGNGWGFLFGRDGLRSAGSTAP